MSDLDGSVLTGSEAEPERKCVNCGTPNAASHKFCNECGQEICRKPGPLHIFVERDFAEGTLCRFDEAFPTELVDRLEPAEWSAVISEINKIFADAEQLSCNTYFESALAILTAHLSLLFYQPHYSKCMHKLAAYIGEENETLFHPNGIHLHGPFEHGLRVLEISDFDGAAGGEGGDAEGLGALDLGSA